MNRFKVLPNKFCFLAFFLVAQVSSAAQLFPPALSAYFPNARADTSLVIKMGAEFSAALVGPITPGAVQQMKRLIDKNNIQVLYIDSDGGDVASAVDLANFLRDKKIRLVVAGRCLSACANFIFPAARSKSVLPGSLLGIHGRQFHFSDKSGTTTINQADGKSPQELSEDPTTWPKISALLKIETDFYKNYGINTILYGSFQRYIQRRNASLRSAKETSYCPVVDFWILSRQDMKTMGVKGLGTIWTPKNAADAKVAALRLGLNPHTTFFGDTDELSDLCQERNGFFSFLRGLLR